MPKIAWVSNLALALGLVCIAFAAQALDSGTKWINIHFISHPGPIWLEGKKTYVAANDIRTADGATTFRFMLPTLFAAMSQSDSSGSAAWKVRSTEYRAEFRCGTGRDITYHVTGFVEYEGEMGTGAAHELPQVVERERTRSVNFRDGKLPPLNAAELRKLQPGFCPEPARPAPVPYSPVRKHRDK